MKIIFQKYIIVVVLLSFITFFAEGQRSNGLTVEGKISVQEGSVEGAIIQMYRDGRRLDNYGVSADGRYRVELNYNHKFELIFEREGNFSQKIVVKTAVPNSVLQSNPKFPPFPVNVNLFTEIEGIDRSFSKKTVLKIYYSPNVDNFISELYYNNAQIKSLINQAILQSKIIGKEADYLSKLTKAEIAELRKEYNELLEQAGKQYGNEQFLAALDGFKAASKIFPKEQFPKDRISEIKDLLGLIMAKAELNKALAERFATLIKEGDLLFAQKKYSNARNSYSRALSIKPTDSYALQQVAKIKELLGKQQVEKQYNDLIAQADNSFQQILYNEAKNRYQSALQLKPNEIYPKNRIKEIDKVLVEQAKNLKNQESYKQAMFQAESLFNKQFYEKSLASYQNALSYKPEDPAATQKIDEIKLIMQEIVDRIQYDKYIKIADKAFKKKLYTNALNNYKEAFALFPDEKHPKNQIDEINKILDLKQSFADLVYKADNQFIAENYDASKSLYQQALEIRSNDKHSLDRIREIDRILTKIGVDANYKFLIADADNFFAAKNYEKAKGKYNTALGVKPKEKYPKDKIAEINSILQQIAKLNKQYQQTIAKADGQFKQKNYKKARITFAAAGELKPEETYPPEMIAKIDGLIAEQARILAEQKVADDARLKAAAEAEKTRLAEAAAAESARLASIRAQKDKKYANAIFEADKLFEAKDYANSRNGYRAALSVKPEETYPQERINEIDDLLSALATVRKEQKLLNKNYLNLIQQADRFFEVRDFKQAKIKYEGALILKPGEEYPTGKIAEIEKNIQQQKVDEQYRGIIVVADGFFKMQEYLQAKTEYEKALAVKVQEQYPKNQIKKIEKIIEKEKKRLLAEKVAAENLQRRKKEIVQINSEIDTRNVEGEAELNELYNRFIQKADAFFDKKRYNISRAWYYQALNVKVNEPYPQQRIAEINKLVESLFLSQRDRDYQKFVDLADSTFRNNNLAVARGWYNRALGIKSNELYPKTQITEIKKKIAERMAGQAGQKFDEYKQKADKAFNGKNFNVARFWYKKTLELRPNDKEIKARLAEIEK